MAQALGCKAGDVRNLDANESAKILAESARVHAPIRLVATTPVGTYSLTGKMEECEKGTLLMEVDSPCALEGLSDEYEPLHATIDRGRLLYFFHTHLLKASRNNNKQVIRLQPSGKLQAFERRRSPRKSLKETIPVTLSAGNEKDWECTGTLLNVSSGGIACLVQDNQAREGLLEPKLVIAFALPVDQEFELVGQVTNVSRGSQSGTSIVGIEFLFESELDEERLRLSQALEHTD